MELHKLKEKIVKDINESTLPIDAIYFVLKEILNSVSEIYNNEVLAIKEEEKKTKEVEDGTNNIQ